MFYLKFLTLGIFSSDIDAEYAIHDLKRVGYSVKDISIMAKDIVKTEDIADATGVRVTGGIISGAAAGSILGGLTGLLIRIGVVTLPGVGPFLVGGPIAVALGLSGSTVATVTGANAGAFTGGLIGALINLGLPEEDARIYEDQINNGGIMLAIPCEDKQTEEVRTILEENDADQVRTIAIKPSSLLHHSYYTK